MSTLEQFKSKIAHKGFLDDEIMNMAEKLGEEFKGITTTKMRQYFEDIKGLRRIIESGARPEQIKTKLQLTLSRIHYDTKRATKKKQLQSMTNLKDFISSAISKVLKSNNVLQEATDFSIFFENFYGYFYFYAEKQKGEEE